MVCAYWRQCVLGLVMLAFFAPETHGQDATYKMLTGRPGSTVDIIGIGLTTLIKSRLRNTQVDIIRPKGDAPGITSLTTSNAQFALLTPSIIEGLAANDTVDLRAVIQLWPLPENDKASPMGKPDTTQAGIVLVARADVDDALVYRIIEAMMQDQLILKMVDVDSAQLSIERAMVDLPLPLHAGATRYLEHAGAGSGSKQQIQAAPLPSSEQDDVVAQQDWERAALKALAAEADTIDLLTSPVGDAEAPRPEHVRAERDVAEASDSPAIPTEISAPATTTGLAATDAARSPVPGGVFRVQLAAMRTRANARRAWQQLRSDLGGVLSGLEPHFEYVETDNGIFHRLQVGSFASAAAADSLCDELKQRSATCFVVQR